MGCSTSYTYDSDDDSIIDELSDIYFYRRSKIYLFICYSYDKNFIKIKNFFDNKTDYKIMFLLKNNITISKINFKLQQILDLVDNNNIYEIWISIFNNENLLKVSDYPDFNNMFQTFLNKLPININIFCLFDFLDYNINFNLNFIIEKKKLYNNYIFKNFKSNIIIFYGTKSINNDFFNIFFNNINNDIITIYNKLYYFSKKKYKVNIKFSFNKKIFIYKTLI